MCNPLFPVQLSTKFSLLRINYSKSFRKSQILFFFCVCPGRADPPEKLQLICPTCPLLLPVDSQHAVKAAAITLAHYKRQSTLSAGLGVKRIMRAAAQAGLKRHFLNLNENMGEDARGGSM